MQRRQRLAETISGTVGWALLAGLWWNERDKPEKDKTIQFNWDMPQKSEGKAQWIAEGKKPYTLGIKVPGTKERVMINWNRGGLEVLAPAIGTIAAMENARLNGRDMNVLYEIPNYAGLIFAPYGARRDYFTERGFAQAAGHKLSPFIPFSGALRTFNKVADTRDTSSFRGATLSSIPVVGAFTGHPALNFYGDPVSERPASWSFRLGLPINVTLPESPDNEKAYTLIQEKGVIPTFPTRPQTEEKYGALTDEQWYEWRRGVGQEIKGRVVKDFDALMQRSPDNVKKILNHYQDIGDAVTARKLKLKLQPQ